MKNFILSFSVLSFLFLACKQNPTADAPKTVKQYSIEQFYENIRTGGGFWSPDETKLLVHSDESGIFNLYEINVADGSKRQVTRSTDESFFAVGYVPRTGQILYSSDKGGNEISHIYLLGEDGTARDLTPGEQEKADFYGWSLDKTAFYYGSNKRNPQFFDVYKMNVGAWKPEMIYQNDEGLDVTGISWDEKLFALQKTITTSENQLFLFDRASKKMTEISSPSAKGSYTASGFSKDGKNFDYITNADNEFAYLVRYDLTTGERKTLFETNWDVMYSYDSENEKYRVIGINEDGKNSLKIIDNASGKEVAFPQIPDGDVLSVSISESENWMRLTVGTSKAPSNLYAYNFETKALKKLTETLNPEINPEDLVSATVVRYKSFDGLEIPAIYYKPLTASAQNKVPALVWVHGGPGGQSRVGYFSLIQYLVNNGYAVLAVNNRGSSGYGKTFFKMDDLNHGDKDLKDCIWGKKWLQEQDYIDSEKIGIIGGSYGGYMTINALSRDPEYLFACGITKYGDANLISSWAQCEKRLRLYTEIFLGHPADNMEQYLKGSPITDAKNIQKPVLILHGLLDTVVPPEASEEWVEALKRENKVFEYKTYATEPHGFLQRKNLLDVYERMERFLDWYLLPK